MLDAQKYTSTLFCVLFEQDCLKTDIIARSLGQVYLLFEGHFSLNAVILRYMFHRCDSLHSAGWISSILG